MAAAKLRVVVVFPTPPFWLKMANRGMRGPSVVEGLFIYNVLFFT